MSKKSRNLGRWGEKKAREYLYKFGINCIDQNKYTKYGEIDLIGMDGETFVFFEVKTLRSKRFGFPEVSVDKKKQQHMIKSALAYINEEHDLVANWRIDVISITLDSSNKTEIQWFKNAVSG